MNKLLKIILYLFLAIVIIFGILVFIGWKASGNKSFSADDCTHIIAPGIPGDLGADYCNYSLAERKSDSSYCNKIKDVDEKTSCEVLFESTPDKCASLKNNSACYTGFATIKKDAAVCAKADYANNHSGAYECYQSVAIAMNDSSICDKIIVQYEFLYTNYKYACLAITKNDSSICEQAINSTYGTINSDGCYSDFAKAKNDRSICNKIKNSMQRGLCQNPNQTLIINPDLVR
jgi:hypothetical protein